MESCTLASIRLSSTPPWHSTVCSPDCPPYLQDCCKSALMGDSNASFTALLSQLHNIMNHRKPKRLSGNQLMTKIEEIRQYAYDQLPKFRVTYCYPVLSKQQKTQIDKQYDRLFKEMQKQTRERSCVQAGLFDYYLSKLHKIPPLDASDEKLLIEEVLLQKTWGVNQEAVNKILYANKRLLLPLIAFSINEWTANKDKVPPVLDSRIRKLADNPYFTFFELVLLGEQWARSTVVRWAKVTNNDYTFSDYIKDNSIFLKKTVAKYLANTIAEMGMHLEIAAINRKWRSSRYDQTTNDQGRAEDNPEN